MQKTIQTKLIHLLGGYTKEEVEISYRTIHDEIFNHGWKHCFISGVKYLAMQLEQIAIQNYGCSKQEWIDKIYSKIQEALKGNVK